MPSVAIFIQPAKGVAIFIQPASLSCDYCGSMQAHAHNLYRRRRNITYYSRRSISYRDICGIMNAWFHQPSGARFSAGFFIQPQRNV